MLSFFNEKVDVHLITPQSIRLRIIASSRKQVIYPECKRRRKAKTIV